MTGTLRSTHFPGKTLILAIATLLVTSAACTPRQDDKKADTKPAAAKNADTVVAPLIDRSPIDTAAYNKKIAYIANGDSTGKWPVKAPYPLDGAILPFKRIVAFYGNLYSKNMGILGELPRKEMLAKLKQECAHWAKADPNTPVVPALHYIAVTAQGAPGKNNTYRMRMPFHQIDSVLSMAREINALVFIDVQIGMSSLQEEIPQLEQYLKMPNVHLGIDPEFAMRKSGKKPGSVIGTLDAADINWTSEYLAKLVKANNLPPKILVVHRFTQAMMTNYKNIKTRPETQIVVDMDGWGEPPKKKGTYKYFVQSEPVQFTGFKLFYKNDLKIAPHQMLTPEEVVKLRPSPIYIQYQ